VQTYGGQTNHLNTVTALEDWAIRIETSHREGRSETIIGTPLVGDGIVQSLRNMAKARVLHVNKSHGVAYSQTTYVCAYLKANYPIEFFCALMSVRSQVMQPKDWASKASEYVQEAKTLGVEIFPPSVQHSTLGFHIANDKIYFGLNGIRGVGQGVARALVKARRTPFTDIYDFVLRMSSKVNRKAADALARAGAFDSMGYARQEMIDALPGLYDYKQAFTEHHERTAKNLLREQENIELKQIIERRTALRKQQARKTGLDLTAEEFEFLEASQGLRLHRTLKTEEPERPEITRHSKIRLGVKELIEQGYYLGCFLTQHPVRILYPQATPIGKLYIGCWDPIAGQVSARKDVVTRKGKKPMCFLEIADDTGTVEVVVFPRQFAELKAQGKLPEAGQLVLLTGKVESEDDTPSMVLNTVEIYKET
jgi:DNA polymerase III alpha subunit